MIVVSDTTPIISFLKVHRLELLKTLYGKIIVPGAVYQELTSNSAYEMEREEVIHCDFISIGEIQNEESVKILRNVTGLDAGESEALVLYDEWNADLLLMDERKGRQIANKMSIQYIGTMGILMLSFDEGLLVAEEVKAIIDEMLENNIRLSHNLCVKVLQYVGYKER